MEKKHITTVPDPGVVQIRDARQNNLKGIDLDLPLGKLNVISGPSGSGKSSLAFDTIYAEGQRRYVETFSPYTRQFLERMDKPKVGEIRGIPPAIAIEQSNHVKSTRSTVGTMTEINDYLKILMPRVAIAHCPECAREIRPETAKAIVDQIFAQLPGESLLVTFGVPVPPKTDPAKFFDFLKQQGYLRVWIENAVHRTDAEPDLKRLPAVVRVVQDRVTLTAENRTRITESVETAISFGKGKVAFIHPSTFIVHPFSTGWHCAHCDIDITPPTPGLFSFNNPLGACPACRGFGRSIGIDLERAIPDRSLSIYDGVVKPFQSESGQECQRDLVKYAELREISVHRPFELLAKADQDWVLHGDDANVKGEELWQNDRWYGVKGFFNWLETKTYKMHVRVLLSRYRSYNLCEACNGGRFQPATLNFRLDGKTLPELAVMPVSALCETIQNLKSKIQNDPSAEMLRNEVAARLRYLVEVGLGYLSLDRPTRTLSGGEVERVNLTTCLGASLVNTLFVMDEPTVGLHPRDVGQLIRVMKNLRDKGNTLLVVEHEESVIRAADNLIEIGPGRGEAGGELVFNGSIADVLKEKKSLTADYLTGRKTIPVPKKRRKAKTWIKVQGASEHNLRNIDVDFPLGVFACVTGVSGSGKSTLIHDVLYQNLLRAKSISTGEEIIGKCRKITGAGRIENIVMVDQSPLSRTPRSSPAVYLGVFEHIRNLFGNLPESQEQGLTPGTFSFNSGTGRCERCGGNGFEKIEMQFLSDIFVRCPECEGTRYRPHVLKIKHRGKSIHDVLELTVREAIRFFDGEKMSAISGPLKILEEVGLGYLRLGQPLNVLSGGESQRLKLVSHLTSGEGKNNLLIFDEPTTGLHFDDVALLLKTFNRLVEQGNSLIVIEHNLEVIKSADHVIDLGPEAGVDGGIVVASGTPEEVASVEESHTGRYLRGMLGSARVPRAGFGVPPKRTFSDEDEVFEEGGAERETLREVHDGGTPSSARETRALPNSIGIHGAREHNLKNISLDIPRDKMVIITGLSGSGKSTLAFDILFAEGQRRFLDSMSPYARQFVEQLEKPDVDLLTGLPPTVAIEQRVTRGGGKSTVATVTEVYHFLRLLFAKLGTQFCPKCNLPVQKQSVVAITKQAEAAAGKDSVKILAPLVKAKKGFHTEIAKWAAKQGFETLLVDGEFVDSEGFVQLERFKEHSIDALIGETGGKKSVKELVEQALKVGKGAARILDSKNRSTILSTEMSCPGCGESFEELDPRLFSFNSPHGWCNGCRGFGEVWDASEESDGESVLESELNEERQHESLDDGQATQCPLCKGSRLNVIARNVRLQGMTLDDFVSRPVMVRTPR
jgi:excinuclease ABC subunit A